MTEFRNKIIEAFIIFLRNSPKEISLKDKQKVFIDAVNMEIDTYLN
jgi:hypothetical protein